ncbi:glycerol-3-phosphate responsive antiterminator, partial [Zhenhengia sp.]|uniref:glycerol-3-phosphate responsive antiterminator n=1 Tax=Zhenhengia sp. TaxID=2944208 RepID=UPI00307950B5
MRDMDKNVFIEKMELNPIIGALKDKGELEAIKASQCEIVFVLTTDIFEIEDTVRQLEQEGKMV